jgi:hypothetical protein
VPKEVITITCRWNKKALGLDIYDIVNSLDMVLRHAKKRHRFKFPQKKASVKVERQTMKPKPRQKAKGPIPTKLRGIIY